MAPTGSVVLRGDMVTLDAVDPDVLQVFEENEIAEIVLPAGVTEIFPRGPPCHQHQHAHPPGGDFREPLRRRAHPLLPPAAAAQRAGGLGTPVVFTAAGCAGGGGTAYTLTLYRSPLTASQRAAFENAAARWEQVITADLPSSSP